MKSYFFLNSFSISFLVHLLIYIPYFHDQAEGFLKYSVLVIELCRNVVNWRPKSYENIIENKEIFLITWSQQLQQRGNILNSAPYQVFVCLHYLTAIRNEMKDDGLTEIMFPSIYKPFLCKTEKGKKKSFLSQLSLLI